MENQEPVNNQELYKALLDVQSKKLTVKREDQAYNYRYADLERIWTVLYEPLAKAGILVVQTPIGSKLVTSIVHPESGQVITSEMDLIVSSASKNHMQDLGAAITYARRYALTTIFNVVVNDDDNESNTQDTDKNVAKPNSTTTPTDKQLNLARDLLKNKGYDQEKINTRLKLVKTSQDASTLIDNLLKNKTNE